MKILGHGVDIAPVARIEKMLRDHPERFVERCFTAREAQYANASPGLASQRFAARFAAKEAALKALGTGWRNGIAWTDVEVALEPSGAPRLVVTGEAGRLAAAMGVTEWFVSLSHTDGMAVASVLAMGREER